LRLNKTGGVALFIVFALGARSTHGAYTPPAEREVENQRQEGLLSVPFLWPHDQDRAVGMTDDGVGHAPHEGSSQSTVPSAAYHDEVRADVFS
jgi:hypothetical protein